MICKPLSWVTFGVLATGMLPFVAHPSVSPSLSSDLDTPPVTAYGGVLPVCGACSVAQPQEYQKPYAVDKYGNCTPDKEYRLYVRLAKKIICENGGYWVCEDTSSMVCSVYIERPPCPEDTCRYTL